MAGVEGQKSKKPKQLPKTNGERFISGLDGRCRLAKELHGNLKALLADLGGEANLSYQRLSLAKRATFIEMRLASIEGQLANGEEADLNAYLQGTNSLIGLFRTLGLNRKAKSIPTPQEYYQSKKVN